MSTWTDFRDKIEGEIEPAIAKGIAFLHTVETLAESEALGDAEQAASAAVIAVENTTGDVEAKALAALEAFGSALLGYAVAIVKKAETSIPAIPTAPVAE